jgi:hypothetical protein
MEVRLTADTPHDPAKQSQFRDVLKPSQARTAATTQATQLAHNGIELVAPTVMGQPLAARTNCSNATMAKISAARRE